MYRARELRVCQCTKSFENSKFCIVDQTWTNRAGPNWCALSVKGHTYFFEVIHKIFQACYELKQAWKPKLYFVYIFGQKIAFIKTFCRQKSVIFWDAMPIVPLQIITRKVMLICLYFFGKLIKVRQFQKYTKFWKFLGCLWYTTKKVQK